MAVKNYGIRDQWTNLDKLNNVDIKSVDGVIESVKINGEEAGGGGSSDFSTATVTLTNPPQGGGTVEFEQSVYISVFGTMVGGGGGFSDIESSIPFVLYKGEGYANFPLKQNFAVTGDIEYDQEFGGLIIRGDGTLTIS